MSRPPLFLLTDRAATQVERLLAKRSTPACGVRISLKTKGCSGLAYALAYVEDPKGGDEKVETKGVCIYVDPKAVMFLIGTEMDYTDDPVSPGFTFNNPNAVGQCGCGESFHV